MSKKVLCFAVVLCFIGSADADVWFRNIEDMFYDTPGNWQNGTIPDWDGGLYEKVNVRDDETVCVIRDGVVARPRNMYQTASNSIVMLGGIWDCVEGWDNIGRGRTKDPDHFALRVIADGDYNLSGNLVIPLAWAPRAGTGEIDAMKGRLNVYGGVTTLGNIEVRGEGDLGEGLVDVRGGVLNLVGDERTELQGYLDTGLLIAYNGYPGAEIDVSYDQDTDITTVKALSGLNPSPPNQAPGVSPSVSQLTWTTPDDPAFAGLKKKVYFGTYGDVNWPDFADPNLQAAFEDRDYRSTWVPKPNLPVLEANDTDNSVDVTLAPDEEYWWQVDYQVDDANVVYSYVFTFDTKNTPPEVDADGNVYTWLDGGTRTVTLAGQFTKDDGSPAPATPTWSVISALTPYEEEGDPVAIDPGTYAFVDDNPNLLDAQITFTVAGTYILELDAFDGELSAPFPDTMTVFVRDDACKAAVITPGFEFLAGDTNGDCVVTLADVADVAGTWLNENFLTTNFIYNP